MFWRWYAIESMSTGDIFAESENDVYRLTCPREEDRLIVVNALGAGYRGQIRVLNVLDAWPPTTEVSAPILAAALGRRYAGTFDALWLRSQPAGAEQALARHGFIRHNFPAPLGWWIDRNNRLPAWDWYLMPGESE